MQAMGRDYGPIVMAHLNMRQPKVCLGGGHMKESSVYLPPSHHDTFGKGVPTNGLFIPLSLMEIKIVGKSANSGQLAEIWWICSHRHACVVNLDLSDTVMMNPIVKANPWQTYATLWDMDTTGAQIDSVMLSLCLWRARTKHCPYWLQMGFHRHLDPCPPCTTKTQSPRKVDRKKSWQHLAIGIEIFEPIPIQNF